MTLDELRRELDAIDDLLQWRANGNWGHVRRVAEQQGDTIQTFAPEAYERFTELRLRLDREAVCPTP